MLQTILQKREHDPDWASTGVFSAGRTNNRRTGSPSACRVDGALAEVMVFTIAGGGPPRICASCQGPYMEISQVWTRVPKGAPSLRKAQRNLPRRGCREEASPQTESKTTGNGMCPGRKTGLPEYR